MRSNIKKFHEDDAFRRKIIWISFFMAVLIVFRHSRNLDIYGIEFGCWYWFQQWFAVVTDIIVPTFFVISGYLFFQNFDYSCLGKKLKSRLWSLIIPYLIWNVMAFIWYELVASVPFVASHMNTSVEPFNLRNLLLNSIQTRHNITWFIRNLIVYSFSMPFLFFIFKRKISCGILFLGLFIFSVWSMRSYLVYRYAVYGVIYVGGVIAGIHFKNFVRRKYSVFEKVAAFLFLIITTIMQTIGLMSICDFYIGCLYPILRLLQVISVWIVADDLSALKCAMPWWVKSSFAIYVMHDIILEPVEKLFYVLIGKNWYGSICDFVFAPMITLLVVFALIRFGELKFPKTWKILVGGRG